MELDIVSLTRKVHTHTPFYFTRTEIYVRKLESTLQIASISRARRGMLPRKYGAREGYWLRCSSCDKYVVETKSADRGPGGKFAFFGLHLLARVL